jgi:hypothetical protein
VTVLQIAEKLSRTQKVLVSFFLTATLVCFISGVTVLVPNTSLSAVWLIKPDAYLQLLALSPYSGIGFLLLSGVMGATAWGCLHRRLWGWRTALAIFAANGLGDLGQIYAGRTLEGLLGITAVIGIVLWLTRPKVKAAFH